MKLHRRLSERSWFDPIQCRDLLDKAIIIIITIIIILVFSYC